MTTKPVIMIQIADRDWTLDALHEACRMARRSPAAIALVCMIPVQHTAWLGTDWGYMNFSERDQRGLEDYQATVLDYGLECRTARLQYADFADGLVDAAEQLDARIVFAKLPASLLPIWRRFQLLWLNRRLSNQQRQFIPQPTHLIAPMPVLSEQAHEISHA